MGNRNYEKFINQNLVEYFDKDESFRNGGIELTGGKLAEKLAEGLGIKIESVLNGSLKIDFEKKYLVRSWLNQGHDHIKIATPENPTNGQLITASGKFTAHAA